MRASNDDAVCQSISCWTRRADSPRPHSIAKVPREHKAKVMVFVPQYAMSGGTLIALVPTKSR
jgi:hypothetical protein